MAKNCRIAAVNYIIRRKQGWYRHINLKNVREKRFMVSEAVCQQLTAEKFWHAEEQKAALRFVHNISL